MEATSWSHALCKLVAKRIPSGGYWHLFQSTGNPDDGSIIRSNECKQSCLEMKFFYELLLIFGYFYIKNPTAEWFRCFLDDSEHARQVNRVVLENNDMLDSFLTVSKELSILQQKLKTSADSAKVSFCRVRLFCRLWFFLIKKFFFSLPKMKS